MTPRKMRSLRELRRLRRTGERTERQPKHGLGPAPGSFDRGNSFNWPVERIVLNPRVIVDIQVLVEAAHSNFQSTPRPGFVAAADANGRVNSIERIHFGGQSPTSSIEIVKQSLMRHTSGIPVLGLIDQPEVTTPESKFLAEFTNALKGSPVSRQFIVLCHLSVPIESTDARATVADGIAHVASHHIRWSSWSERHDLAAMTVDLYPVDLEVIGEQ